MRKARQAQAKWSQTTFKERRKVMRMLLDYVLEHMEDIARVSCRDSGKTKVRIGWAFFFSISISVFLYSRHRIPLLCEFLFL